MDISDKLTNLKNQLLYLAIRGKLVEQRPEDGTADELYAQIQEEKKKLIADGKLKKEKPLPEITDEEIPFDIPESWMWVHIGDLFLHNTGKALKSSDKEGKELEYITTSNVYWGRFELDDLRSMHFKTSEVERCSVNKGDLLVCEGGDFGRAAIWNEDYSICIQNHLHKLVSMKNELSTQFYLYLFYVYKNKGYLESRGIGIQSLSTNLLHKLVVPLPPLAEQKRIVAKLESYLAVISKAEELIEKKANLDEAIRNKILDLAIRGKLVEQRPEEGSAEELYTQIQEEKLKLIAEGKIKKEKPLPEIKDEEIPFEIPTNWKWARFGKLLINMDSERIPLSVEERKVLKKIYDYYGASGVIDKVENYLFEKKLLLIGEDGANLLSRSKPIAFIAEGKYWVNNHAHVIDYFVNYISIEFVMYFINSISLAPFVTGTAQPKMTQDKLNSIPVPLPPLAEQKRIVAKIEELLPYCEKLK